MKRHTVSAPVEITGIGIHTGVKNTVKCLPRTEPGIVFVCDYANGAKVPVSVGSFSHTHRATILRVGDVEVRTPEHLLSACYGVGITDLTVVLTAPEVPILDGSSQPFVEALLSVGLQDNPGELPIIAIDKDVMVESGNAKIIATPADSFQVTYHLSYPQAFIGDQTVTYSVDQSTYGQEIAPARTYGFEHEVKALLAQGLAKGGSFDNALIIGEEAYLSPLRFPDELARHKVLDVIGDVAVLGAQLKLHLECYASGHQLNMEISKKLSLSG